MMHEFEALCRDNRIPAKVSEACLAQPEFKQKVEEYCKNPTEQKGEDLLVSLRCALRATRRSDKTIEDWFPTLFAIECHFKDPRGRSKEDIFKKLSDKGHDVEYLKKVYFRYKDRFAEYIQRPENRHWRNILEGVAAIGIDAMLKGEEPSLQQLNDALKLKSIIDTLYENLALKLKNKQVRGRAERRLKSILCKQPRLHLPDFYRFVANQDDPVCAKAFKLLVEEGALGPLPRQHGNGPPNKAETSEKPGCAEPNPAE